MTNDPATAEAGTVAPVDVEARRDPVASISGQIAHMSTGSRAALRRMNPLKPGRAAGVVVGLLEKAGLPAADMEAEKFKRWALIAHVAAVLAGTGGANPHSRARPVGRALSAAGYSENRLMRLTAARGPALVDQVVRAARYLAAAGQAPVNLWTLRDLIDPDRAEAARLRLARDYYAASHANEKGNDQ